MNTGYLWSAAGAINYRVYSATIDADNDVEHMNMFASTHMQTALRLFPMTSRMRIQQQPMQMTTKSQMILPTVKQGRRILQISS
jgi:hypothetical protein